MPGTTHHLDITQLVSNPARAIGALHRGGPARQRASVVAHAGGDRRVGGNQHGGHRQSGTRTDPWVLELAPPSTFHIEIAAWNDQTSGVASDPQQLRIGLRASISQPPVEIYWLAELLAFDLPATGAGHGRSNGRSARPHRCPAHPDHSTGWRPDPEHRRLCGRHDVRTGHAAGVVSGAAQRLAFLRRHHHQHSVDRIPVCRTI